MASLYYYNTQAPSSISSRKRSLSSSRSRCSLLTYCSLVIVVVVAVAATVGSPSGRGAPLLVNAFLAAPTMKKSTTTPFVRLSTNTREGRRISKPTSSSSSITAMFVSRTSATTPSKIANLGQRHEQRPSDAEQRSFLAQVAEYRRIKAIETELLLKGKKTTASAAVRTTAPYVSSSIFYYTGGGAASSSSSSHSRISLLTLARASDYHDNDLDKFQDAVRAGQQAREALVTRNMGLVYYCVDAILGRGGSNGGYSYVNKQSPVSMSPLQSLTKQDLIQEGAIGLARAVDRWDAAIGGKFSTYAVYWIRAAVLRCIAERDDLVRVPEHVSVAIRKMTKAAAVLGLDLERVDVILSASFAHASSSSASSSTTANNANWRAAQEAKELAEEAGLTYKQMTEAMKVRQRRKTGILSFEDWMQRGKDYETDLTRAESITESSSATTMTGAFSDDSSEQSEQMKQVFSRYLRPKEMEALSWRYGLVNDHSAAATPSNAAPSSSKSKKDYLAYAERDLFGNIENQQMQEQQRRQSFVVRGKTGESMSFDEVGKRMQVSAEYCRRLCRAGLEKLQRAAEDGSIELGLLY